jgi:hypothetical protein
VVEFAVVLPLLLTILFGILEYGWVFMVRLTLQNAAREGVRLSVLQTTESPYSEVDERIDQVMGPTGLTSSDYTVVMSHASLDPCDRSERVTISIPYERISVTGGFFGPKNFNVTGSSTMQKEGMDCADDEG